MLHSNIWRMTQRLNSTKSNIEEAMAAQIPPRNFQDGTTIQQGSEIESNYCFEAAAYP